MRGRASAAWKNLESATIDDVRAFHATYYRPDNAILVVSGNFDAKQLDAWVDQYFAGIKKPDRPIPRVTVTEPERTKATHVTVYEQNTPLPAVMISYPVPPDSDADMPALTVLNAVMSQGESSRLYETLVYRDQLAQSAETYLDTKQGPGNLAVFAHPGRGQDRRCRRGGAAPRGCAAARRAGHRRRAVRGEERNPDRRAARPRNGRGQGLGTGRLGDHQRRSARLRPADRRDRPGDRGGHPARREEISARRTLGRDPLPPVRGCPGGREGRHGHDRLDGAGRASGRARRCRDRRPPRGPAPMAPPVAGTPIAAAIPSPQEIRLANGLRVLVVEKHDLPLLTASLVATGGGARPTRPTGPASAA